MLKDIANMGSEKSRAPAWKEDEWEPPEPSQHCLPLQELRSKIESLQAEHARKGHFQTSGRVIIVSHTLPYSCTYVRGQAPAAANGHSDIQVKHDPLTSTQLHSPTLSKDAPVPRRDSAQPKAPQNIYEEHGKEHSTGAAMPEADNPEAHWVLTPRRVHAALNAGVKSLSENARILMVAWPGDVRDVDGEKTGAGTLTEKQRVELEDGFASLAGRSETNGIQCVPVWMEDGTAERFYVDYCKTYLWPTFHYLGMSDHQDKQKEAKAWKAYYDANVAYAERVASVYKDGDLIWVQDYHLLLVPQLLRAKFPNAAIGLFLHSPFPTSEFFRCLPRRETILNGMLGANLCCFQTYSYGRHFLSSCVRVCGYEPLEGGIGVDAKGSVTSIAYCPIGIDAGRIEEERRSEGVLPKIDALRQLYKGKKIIVGRDKLDSTKGVLPKLEAFEAFLEHYPEWIGNVVMIQVTTPTASDSPVIARKISRLVDHINGTYGNLSFAPLHHYHQIIDREEYFALLSVADLALITSIRDGMNTTSMEYVLCQKEAKNPLILSEFTGVTGSMLEAVRVNPWDANGCARAINQCLIMESDEKARRHAQLYKRVTTQTAAVWAHTLALRLLESLQQDPAHDNTPPLDSKVLSNAFAASKRRLLMFDYDGTLTPIVKVPSQAVPSKSLLSSLEKLAADPRNVVYIISGRDGDFLSQHLGHIKNLGFSAEHGSFLKPPGASDWHNLTEHIDMSWTTDVEEIFRYYEARTTGSFVEKKRASVTFHYRNADPEYGEFQAKECQALLDTMVEKLPIDVLVGKKNLEVRPAHTHKGEIVKRLTYQHADADLLICAGDDKTDEDMFRAIFAIESTDSESTDGHLTVSPPPSLAVFPALAKTLVPVGTDGKPVDVMTPGPDGKLDLKPQRSNLTRENLFTLGIIPNASRKTIARWYLDEPEHLLSLLEELSQLP